IHRGLAIFSPRSLQHYAALKHLLVAFFVLLLVVVAYFQYKAFVVFFTLFLILFIVMPLFFLFFILVKHLNALYNLFVKVGFLLLNVIFYRILFLLLNAISLHNFIRLR
ncbi:MAG: hypothetical protein ACK55Z_21955, partial [bacterium]